MLKKSLKKITPVLTSLLLVMTIIITGSVTPRAEAVAIADDVIIVATIATVAFICAGATITADENFINSIKSAAITFFSDIDLTLYNLKYNITSTIISINKDFSDLVTSFINYYNTLYNVDYSTVNRYDVQVGTFNGETGSYWSNANTYGTLINSFKNYDTFGNNQLNIYEPSVASVVEPFLIIPIGTNLDTNSDIYIGDFTLKRTSKGTGTNGVSRYDVYKNSAKLGELVYPNYSYLINNGPLINTYPINLYLYNQSENGNVYGHAEVGIGQYSLGTSGSLYAYSNSSLVALYGIAGFILNFSVNSSLRNTTLGEIDVDVPLTIPTVANNEDLRINKPAAVPQFLDNPEDILDQLKAASPSGIKSEPLEAVSSDDPGGTENNDPVLPVLPNVSVPWHYLEDVITYIGSYLGVVALIFNSFPAEVKNYLWATVVIILIYGVYRLCVKES